MIPGGRSLVEITVYGGANATWAGTPRPVHSDHGPAAIMAVSG